MKGGGSEDRPKQQTSWHFYRRNITGLDSRVSFRLYQLLNGGGRASHYHHHPQPTTTTTAAANTACPPPDTNATLRNSKTQCSGSGGGGRSRWRVLLRIMWECLSLVTNGFVWVLALPFAYYYAWLLTERQAILLKWMFMALALDLLLVASIKHFVKRKRPLYNTPGEIFIGPDAYSFPSGHTSRAVLLSLWLAHHFGGETLKIAATTTAITTTAPSLLWPFRLGGVLGMATLLIALSRIALGRHFILDVVGGAALGAFEASLFVFLLGWSSSCLVVG